MAALALYRRCGVVALAATLLLAMTTGTAGAGAGTAANASRTSRISVSSTGEQGNQDSAGAGQIISASTRYIAFSSRASNLVAGDTNETMDAFVRDRWNGQTKRVSVGAGGVQGNGSSRAFAISADGRFVAFNSDASNLVPGDTNRTRDVFVRDLAARVTRRVSIAQGGHQANRRSDGVALSPDGRFVVFNSNASTLLPGDTLGTDHVFLRDLKTGVIKRVSDAVGGKPADNSSYGSAISADGRLVVFFSYASNLVAGDTNAEADVFVHDVASGTTRRVSVGLSNQESNNDSGGFQGISADGRFVVFESLASNLVPGDTNRAGDVFVYERATGVTRRASVGSQGQANNYSTEPAISADGRFVVFISLASNLTPGDGNGLEDLFRRDLTSGTTERLSKRVTGLFDGVDPPSVSADGRKVIFVSSASDLVPGDTNGSRDVFVWVEQGGAGPR